MKNELTRFGVFVAMLAMGSQCLAFTWNISSPQTHMTQIHKTSPNLSALGTTDRASGTSFIAYARLSSDGSNVSQKSGSSGTMSWSADIPVPTGGTWPIGYDVIYVHLLPSNPSDTVTSQDQLVEVLDP